MWSIQHIKALSWQYKARFIRVNHICQISRLKYQLYAHCRVSKSQWTFPVGMAPSCGTCKENLLNSWTLASYVFASFWLHSYFSLYIFTSHTLGFHFWIGTECMYAAEVCCEMSCGVTKGNISAWKCFHLSLYIRHLVGCISWLYVIRKARQKVIKMHNKNYTGEKHFLCCCINTCTL